LIGAATFSLQGSDTIFGTNKVARKFLYLVAAIIMLVIAGGFVIAFSEVMVTYAWKKVLGYLLPESLAPEALVQLLTTDYKFAVSFTILIAVLLFKPTGLFRGKSV
jgi:branched-subunit amino acid ABC-type transport system permease component